MLKQIGCPTHSFGATHMALRIGSLRLQHQRHAPTRWYRLRVRGAFPVWGVWMFCLDAHEEKWKHDGSWHESWVMSFKRPWRTRSLPKDCESGSKNKLFKQVLSVLDYLVDALPLAYKYFAIFAKQFLFATHYEDRTSRPLPLQSNSRL